MVWILRKFKGSNFTVIKLKCILPSSNVCEYQTHILVFTRVGNFLKKKTTLKYVKWACGKLEKFSEAGFS